MEQLSCMQKQCGIHVDMETWFSAIMKVKARRKEEILYATNRYRNGSQEKCELNFYFKSCFQIKILF